jgi:CheY-like chemotaxis protein
MELTFAPIRTTMIIEDDQVTSFLNSLLIDELNYSREIVSASDGLEALELLSKMLRFPEIIFLDIKMAGMDGFDFLDNFEKMKGSENTKVIILTSSVDNRDKMAANQHNIYSYLTKPLTKEAITKILEGVMVNHRKTV